MSRAVFRVLACGSKSPARSPHRSARSAWNAAIRSNADRVWPPARIQVEVGQPQSSGVLRPTNRGSMPIRSNRDRAASCPTRANGMSTPVPPGPPLFSSIAPTRFFRSVAGRREIATVMARPCGRE